VEKRLEASLRKAVAFLDGHGYRYAIIGGVALSQWGVIRATYDVGIKVLVPNQDYAAVRTDLRSAFPQPARLQAPRNPLIVAVEIDEVIVDFLLAVPGYDELIVERAAQRDLGGWRAPVCSPEDLVIQKAVAGRGKDWLDLEGLLAAQYGKLDYAYIEDWLRQFAEALDNPDMLDHYRSALERAQEQQP